MSAAAAQPQRFANINLLRAVAALAVVTFHVIEKSQWKSFPTEGALAGLRLGWLGVDLFFVISGFVIGYSALALYRREAQGFARAYWRRRLARIVPLYMLTLLLWIPFAWPNFFQQPTGGWVRQLATHLTFTHNLSTDTFGAMDGVNWSLAVEMQFYLLVAVAIGWLDRAPGWRIWLWGIAVAWAWRAGVLWLHGPMDGGLTFVWTTQLPGTLDEFGAGMFLAKHLLDRPTAHRAHGALWLGAAAAAGCLVMALYFPRASYWDQPMMVVFWRTALAAFLLCAVASAVRLPQFLAHRALWPLDQLGEASYGIYLWHLFAIDIVVTALGGGSVRTLGATLAITVGLAIVSWRCLEKPILALARRRAPPIRVAPATACPRC